MPLLSLTRGPAFAIAEELFPRYGTLVGEDALLFAANKLKQELSSEKLDRLMNAYLELNTWPDVVSALISLRKSGFRLALLSNFTHTMLDANIKHARLDGIFDHVLSTDQTNTYKPDPRAYQLGIGALKLTREEILFAAFAGWDAAGAKLFGYPTSWVNRQKLPPEEMGFQLAQSLVGIVAIHA
jgi:2-haloacid dehalogenase